MVSEIVALIEQKFRVARNDKFEHHAEIKSDYFGSIKSSMGKFFLNPLYIILDFIILWSKNFVIIYIVIATL